MLARKMPPRSEAERQRLLHFIGVGDERCAAPQRQELHEDHSICACLPGGWRPPHGEEVRQPSSSPSVPMVWRFFTSHGAGHVDPASGRRCWSLHRTAAVSRSNVDQCAGRTCRRGDLFPEDVAKPKGSAIEIVAFSGGRRMQRKGLRGRIISLALHPLGRCPSRATAIHLVKRRDPDVFRFQIGQKTFDRPKVDEFLRVAYRDNRLRLVRRSTVVLDHRLHHRGQLV